MSNFIADISTMKEMSKKLSAEEYTRAFSAAVDQVFKGTETPLSEAEKHFSDKLISKHYEYELQLERAENIG